MSVLKESVSFQSKGEEVVSWRVFFSFKKGSLLEDFRFQFSMTVSVGASS